jgi:hypothetical protein
MDFTFLNALFLAGLTAGIVPIVIHLLQRRRLKRVEFSDLRFLAPLNQQRMRSLNLRRLLLLLLRVLIILLTAVAMARPSIRGSLTKLLPAQARTTVLLLVDTSYSMRTEGESGTALDAAKQAANRLLDALEPGDAVQLMSFDAAPRPAFESPVHDIELARQQVNDLRPSHAGTAWPEALRAALTTLNATNQPNAELYVFSDFTGSLGDSLPADLRALQGDVRIGLVPVGVESFVNVSIDAVRVPAGAVLLEEPARIGATVRNHADDVPAECALQVELAGEPKAEASLRLGAAAQQTQEFTLVATRADQLAGTVRKRADRLPADDTRFFVLPVLAQLRVLLIGTDDNASGSFFIARALAPLRVGKSRVALLEVAAPRFATNDLEGVQVAVVASDAHLTESQAQILVDFVAAGGGLVLWSGQRDTADERNRTLLSRLGDLRLRGVVLQQQGFVSLADLRPSGLLTGFDADELRVLEAVRFTRYAEIVPGGARTLLRFTGGQAALASGDHGDGKYAVFAFDAGIDGSDLPLSSMFLPLVHRTVVELAGETGRQRLEFDVGERIEVQAPLTAVAGQASSGRDGEDRWASAGVSDGGAQTASDRSFIVTTPDGRQEAIEARYVGRRALLAFGDTSIPGHYRFQGGGREFVRAVNVDVRESDLHRMELADFETKLGLAGVERVEEGADISRHVREARHGKELYKLIVVMVLALLTLELFMARAARTAPPA